MCASVRLCACVCVCVWVLGSVGVWMRVSACSLSNPARKAHAPYCDVIWEIIYSISIIFFDII